MKPCRSCGTSKRPTEFYLNKAQRDGLSTQCRECFKETVRKSKKKNIDRVRRERARYASTHREQIAANGRAWKTKRRSLFPELDASRALARYHLNHPNQPCVYVVGTDRGSLGPVKIGHTTNLPVRLQMLQNGSPIRLIVVHVMKFDTKPEAVVAEYDLRKRFRSCRIHGEWFQPDDPMTLWIESILTT